MRKAIILVGHSGSGKSTWARALWTPALRIVSANSYFKHNPSGEYCFDASKLPEAHGYCMRNFVEIVRSAYHLGGPCTVIVDNTNTTIEEILPYYAVAKAHGFAVEIKRFDGDFPNVHGVSAEVIAAQKFRISRLRFPSYLQL